jgi:two-component system, sensor histidine kinase and response regulator
MSELMFESEHEKLKALNSCLLDPQSPEGRGSLLIVDDEDGPRHSLWIIFKDEYNLLMAEDGPTAIELARRHPVHVVLLDICMPGMSGIEVLKHLKCVNPNIEVIMMTAFETADMLRQALRLRASDFINKPFDVGTMRRAVGRAMQRYRAGKWNLPQRGNGAGPVE